MAVMDAQSATAPPTGAIARLRAMIGGLLGRFLGGTSEASVTRRLAGTIFIIRVVSAATGLPVANPARALDGRFGLWRLRLCLDLGAAARQHDGFRHLGVGAKDHPGISRHRRARAAARLPLRQPLDDVCRLLRGLAGAGWRGETAVAVDRDRRGGSALHRLPHACRPSWSPTPRTASRARTTGCGSG